MEYCEHTELYHDVFAQVGINVHLVLREYIFLLLLHFRKSQLTVNYIIHAIIEKEEEQEERIDIFP